MVVLSGREESKSAASITTCGMTYHVSNMDDLAHWIQRPSHLTKLKAPLPLVLKLNCSRTRFTPSPPEHDTYIRHISMLRSETHGSPKLITRQSRRAPTH